MQGIQHFDWVLKHNFAGLLKPIVFLLKTFMKQMWHVFLVKMLLKLYLRTWIIHQGDNTK